jgi:hypothetical protein
MGNPEMRKQLASLSFSEKVDILEKLRDRSQAFAAAGFRRHSIDQPSNVREFCNCSGWESCGCGHPPHLHCVRCGRELSAEQLAAARQRGSYSKLEE